VTAGVAVGFGLYDEGMHGGRRGAHQHPARTVWLVGIPFIVLVAAFRLYLGAHYLSDVIASTVFAAGTVLIAVAIAGPWLLRLRNREESTTAG